MASLIETGIKNELSSIARVFWVFLKISFKSIFLFRTPIIITLSRFCGTPKSAELTTK